MGQNAERLKSIDFYKNNKQYIRKGEFMKFNCAYTELVDIHKLVQNPKNNNHHPKEQIDRLAKIIDYQGQRSPIVVSNRSGFIVKGHGRLEAIRKLGWGKAAVDYQDYESEAQEYADMTADNQIAMWAEFDNNMLMSEIPELGDMDLDMLGMKDLKLDIDEVGMPELASGEKSPFQQMTFTLADEQAEQLKQALEKAKKTEEYNYIETFGNENSNGNAIYCIIQGWLNG